MSTGAGALRVSEGVAWTRHDGRVYVAAVPAGPIAVLEGTAALIWELALDGPGTTLTERVAGVTGQPVDTVREDVTTFVGQLVDGGWLVGTQ